MGIRRLLLFVSMMASASIVAVSANEPPAKPTPLKPDPLSSYSKFERAGFRVMVNDRIGLLVETLRNLEQQLQNSVDAMPPCFAGIVKDVTIWVELNDAARRAHQWPSAAALYLPIDSANLRLFGVLQEKAGGIEVFADPVLFDEHSEMVSRFPGWLVHEFAHAVHDRVLGLDNKEVLTAYRQAMDRKLYDHVETHRDYRAANALPARGRAYAATNHFEFFAELSAAYLNKNTYYFPFSQDELKKHDPVTFDVMQSIWKSNSIRLVNQFSTPVSLWWIGENTRKHKLFDLMPKEERTFDGWHRLKLVGEDMLTGDEHRFERPKEGEAVWRLNQETIASK